MLQRPPSSAAALRARLEAAGYTFRGVPHALFSAKGPEGIVTFYRSGKLVLQGAEPERCARMELGLDVAGTAAPELVSEREPIVLVGSDESGKGDFFGPLVVAAVRLEPDVARALAGGGVRDCKLLSDDAVGRLAGALRARLPHAIHRLDPPQYNAEHARVRNLNPMLAALHAAAIRELAGPGMRVVVDQFAAPAVLERALGGLDVRLEQRPRAESELAVAAASILARDEFLQALARLSEEYAVDLAKGAGTPTDRAALRFVELHGVERLGEVAKLHFANARRLPAPRSPGP